MTALRFRVYGVAEQGGSKRAFLPRGWSRPVVTDTNRNLKGWQALVAQHASQAIEARPEADRQITLDAVRLSASFYLPRPKTLPVRRPRAHVKKPDLSKLVRALEDALTGVVYRDDSQIVELLVGKYYAAIAEVPHVDVAIEVIPGLARPIIAAASPAPLFAEALV
jgi:crossover junction endodeoxyribonuclease RusA